MRILLLSAILALWGASLPVIAAVRIDGVSAEIEANIRAHLRLDDEACDQEPVRIRHRFERAPAQIRAALRPFGYYQPIIDPTLSQPEGECWEATFVVEPGEPVLIGAAEIDVLGEGATLPAFRAVIDEADLAPGTQLRHRAYDETRNRMLVAARELGFFDAELTARALEVDPAAQRAHIRLVLDTGPRYRFGELHINGQMLDEALLRRYVEYAEGAPFEQRWLRKLHNDLVRGDFFASVEVRAVPQEDRTADVFVNLQEGRRIRYGVGFGFGTDTGLVVRGDMVARRVNRGGHRLELDAELSRVRQNGTFNYRIPGRRPQNDWYSFYGGLNREDTDAVESIAWKMGVRENRFHTLRWTSTPFLELVAERFRQDGEWNEKLALVPGYGISFLDANAADRPTRGIRLRAELAGASDVVLSDTSFVRLLLSGKTILPVSDRARLIVRGEAGWMESGNFDKVPPTWRFFAGGDRSVRGYDYQSLGPTDEDGKSIGGSRLLTGSVEMDWRIRERWSGALFLDAGNVGEDNLLSDLPWSLGFGARWYSPVGPIRVDLAFPQQGDNDFRLHISMGPDL